MKITKHSVGIIEQEGGGAEEAPLEHAGGVGDVRTRAGSAEDEGGDEILVDECVQNGQLALAIVGRVPTWRARLVRCRCCGRPA